MPNEEGDRNMNHNAAIDHDLASQKPNLINVQYLKELTEALSGAVEALDSVQALDVEEGISFYDEVRRFEIGLIRTALNMTAGSQRRAAELLRLKATTLNAKIKMYNINWRNGYSA